MASEPIPEPLTNQNVKPEREPELRDLRGGPELVREAVPPVPADRELPRAPRTQEWKGAVQEKLQDAKETAVRAKEAASQAVEQAKEQASAAVSQAKDRAADLYRQSRMKTVDAVGRARSRASYILDEYPLQVIGGVAVVAFVAGVLLRVWRSSRDA